MLLGGLAVMVAGSADRGRQADEWSTYRADAKGSRALYLLLDELGYEVERWHRDLTLLDEDIDLLVVIGRSGLPSAEVAGVRSLVEAGGASLFFGEAPEQLAGLHGVRLVEDLEAASNLGLRGEGNAERVVGVVASLVAPGARVAFDESAHGFSASRGIAAYIADRALGATVLQLLLLALFAIWSIRRGPARHGGAAEAPSRASGADFVQAMAEVYRKGNHRSHAADRLLAALERELTSRRGADPEAVAASLAELHEQCDRLHGTRSGDRELLAFARAVARAGAS